MRTLITGGSGLLATNWGIYSRDAHDEIIEMDINILAGAAIPFIDVKSVFNKYSLEKAGFHVWRL